MPTIKELENRMSLKFKEMDKIIKNSFHFIREDVSEMQSSLDLMKKFIKKEKKRLDYARTEDNKIRDEFRKDVEEFTQKITQLKIALSEVRAIQKEVVLVRDLAQIEDRIRQGFREEVLDLREQVKTLKEKLKNFQKEEKEQEKRIDSLEKGKVKSKKGWFSKNKSPKKSEEEDLKIEVQKENDGK